MNSHRLDHALAQRNQAVGTWVQMNSPETCEIAGLVGFDFVIIDMEHGSFGLPEATAMVKSTQVTGADAVIRVAEGTRTALKQALDIGVRAVLIPALETAEDAAAAVAAARFEPAGRRGACPCVRSVSFGVRPWRECADHQDEVGVWVLIENPIAVENIDEIVKTGIEAVVLGPFDLSMAMGLNGDFHHHAVTEALERVCVAALKAGVEVVNVGLDQSPEANVASAQRWSARGSRITTTLLDRSVLVHAYRNTLNQMWERELSDPYIERVRVSSASI